MKNRKDLYDAIVNGDAKSAIALTKEALAAGDDPVELVNGSMVPAMDEVGQRFESEEYFVPELLISARAMKGALDLLGPLLAEKGVPSAGSVVIGTVKGDLHDIGKNLVASLLEGAGFEVHDLGADVPPELFVQAAREKRASIVALSALLTVTMPAMRTTIDALQRAGLRDHVKVMVGGAPVTGSYAKEIGADGYSENARSAVALARALVSTNTE